jgi:hypothetical protein
LGQLSQLWLPNQFQPHRRQQPRLRQQQQQQRLSRARLELQLQANLPLLLFRPN